MERYNFIRKFNGINGVEYLIYQNIDNGLYNIQTIKNNKILYIEYNIDDVYVYVLTDIQMDIIELKNH